MDIISQHPGYEALLNSWTPLSANGSFVVTALAQKPGETVRRSGTDSVRRRTRRLSSEAVIYRNTKMWRKLSLFRFFDTVSTEGEAQKKWDGILFKLIPQMLIDLGLSVPLSKSNWESLHLQDFL